ncbi:MAG: glycosyltransferase N-terminal domain-containing protein [Ferruginibacter sp.]
MGKLIYNIFLTLYAVGFKVAALFNNKARLGVIGRRKTLPHIQNVKGQVIWMHCASLGEFEQGRPVLESLKRQYPGVIVVLSFFSASGYEAAKNYIGADHIFYLPMDNSYNAKKVVNALQPTLVLWVKYEFWYYYLHELKGRNIPVLLISGIFRASHPFFKWYGSIWREMLQSFRFFFVQNDASANLLAGVGFRENVVVTGDTRFDRVIAIAEKFESLPLIEKFCGESKVLVAGSTWEDDEAELIHYVKANPQIKFIIAPHEIDAANIKDVKKEFVNAILYSELLQAGNDKYNESSLPNVLIIDNVGMLSRLYAYGDISYVGGGFGADGVHNVLEAAVYGKPVIFGPEFEKYAEAIGLVECSGGITIANALELETVLNELWENENLLNEKGAAAKRYVSANAGASGKIVQVVQAKRLLTN